MSRNKRSANGIQTALLSSLEEQPNSHMAGSKRVFINNTETETALTQFAYGFMKSGEQTGPHVHKTMDEYFFVTKGEGTLICGEERLQLTPATFLRVPAGTVHNLINMQEQELEFVYFGIATSRQNDI